jgi:hypothetical protein
MSTSHTGRGFAVTPARVESVRKKLERLDLIRAANRKNSEGLSKRSIAKALSVSPSTVDRWLWTFSSPSVTEIIERAAIDGTPRSELVDELSRIQYALHGWSGYTIHDGKRILAEWHELYHAWDRHLLAFDEYEQVCESMRALTRRVLSQPPCDWRTCSEHPEHLYVICYGQTTMVKSRDWSAWDAELRECHAFKPYPISHYIGWTTQRPPVKRLWQHGTNSAQRVVTVVPGTTYEESVLKQFGACPKCNGSLDYFLENPDRMTMYPEPWDRDDTG